MSDRLDKDQDPLDNKNSLTHWEKRATEDFENSNLSQLERIDREYEAKGPILWVAFQNSASSLANFYKASPTTKPLWIPFQNTATSITALYKDGCDAMRQCFELGKQYGQHKRNDELLAWTKAQRRLLAREDLIGVVCGISPPVQRNPPPPPPSLQQHHRKYARSHHHHHHHPHAHRHGGAVTADRSPRHLAAAAGPQEPLRHAELEEIFSDALAINGLDGAMSNIGIRNSVPPVSGASAANIHSDVIEEFHRRRQKRPAPSSPSSSPAMDSPTRKRTRLL